MDLFTGTWRANLSKSRRHANHRFESATLRFDVSGDTVTLAQAGVNAAGHQESGTTTLRSDGKEHAVSPEAPDIVVITKWVGSRILETTAKKGGEVIGQGTYEVSDDDKMLTATVRGVDASGAEFEQVIVFDRE